MSIPGNNFGWLQNVDKIAFIETAWDPSLGLKKSNIVGFVWVWQKSDLSPKKIRPGQKSWWRTVAVNQKTNCVESNLKLGPDQPTKPTTFARWKGFLQSDTYRRWYIWSIYPITKRHCALSLVTDPLVQKFLYSEVSEAPSCIWSSKDCDRGKWRLKQRIPWVRKQLKHWRYFNCFLLSPSYNFRDKLLSQRPLQTACHYYWFSVWHPMYRGWSLASKNLITFVAFGEWLPLIHCNPRHRPDY